MKKIVYTASLLAVITSAKAQEFDPNDLVRFSSPTYSGSARATAMGGAIGAVGADLSSIHINPAGTALNYFSTIALNGSLNNNVNTGTYLQNVSKAHYQSANLDNIGVSMVFNNFDKNNPHSNKFVFSITKESNYNNDNHFFAQGSNQQSIANYFLIHANKGYGGSAVPQTHLGNIAHEAYEYADDFSTRQAVLGYYTYLIDKVSTGTGYTTPMGAGAYQQQLNIVSKQANDALALNFAYDLNNKWFIGLNLNYQSLDFSQKTQHSERTNTPNANGVHSTLFKNIVTSNGSGFSFDFGVIGKITDNFRAGLSYNSPKWYSIVDSYEQSIETKRNTGRKEEINYVEPKIITVLESYRLRTPSTFTISGAYTFDKKALISVDYSVRDYSVLSYSDNYNSFGSINAYYKNNMAYTNDLRVGGEYRWEQWSLRTGYRYIDSPFKTQLKPISNTNIYSTGVGYSYGNKRIDVSYSYQNQDSDRKYISNGLNDNVHFNTQKHSIMVGYNIYY